MIRYEFLMQIRKRSLWISMGLLAVITVLGQGDAGPRYLPDDASARVVASSWAFLWSLLLPIVAGMVLADRLVRDDRLGVSRLLESLPTTATTRVMGRFLGALAATATPIFLATVIAGGAESISREDPAVLLWTPIAFGLVLLPGLVFVGAFAMVVPLLLTAPLFRVLFVGYWFWGNMLGPSYMPSLAGTLLTPVGDYTASWLLGERALYAGADGWLQLLRPEPNGVTAALSVALLLGVGLIPLLVGSRVLARRATA